jgi:cytochrome c-type biogenesis protein CcmH/NrfG
MKYFLFAFFVAAAPTVAPAQSDEGRWNSGKRPSIEELDKNAAALEEAVKRDSANVELYIRLGFTYAKLEKADEAQKAFETVVRLNPKRAIAHYMLGLIYEKKSLTEKAIAAWQACLENASEPHIRETALKHLHHLKNRQAE